MLKETLLSRPTLRRLFQAWTNPFFPWRLFLEFIFRQAVLIILFAAIFGFLASLYFHSRAGEFMLVADMLPIFNQTLVLLILGLVVVFLLVSFWMSRRVMQPIGSMLRRLNRNTPSHEPPHPEEMSEVEPGELSELASAIESMRRDLRGKEERLAMDQTEAETLMSSIGDAILAVDVLETSLYYNSHFAVMFGTGGSGRTRFKVGEIFRAPEILDAFHRTLREGSSQSVTVQYFLGYDRITRYFQLSVNPLRKRNTNEIYGALGIFHDVSELKRAEQIRIEFVGNVSHELRTPLTAIKGYADTLRQDVQDQQFEMVDRYTEVIQKNVGRLMNLVNDLLDLSSLESGFDVQKIETSCREVTEKALAQVESKRAEKKNAITAVYKTETVLADPERVEQILINLTENAIKYIPSGLPISIIWESAPHATILRVKDQGPGIPKIHQDRLFERFYRVDDDRNSQTGGTGLGLAIVKHIMQRHNGTVRVQSAPHEGTEFICTFPSGRDRTGE